MGNRNNLEKLVFYEIIKITDLQGNNKKDGRYPMRIGRRFAFGLGFPSVFMRMAICYRPKRYDDYGGTLFTSEVMNIKQENDTLIVTTQNSIYYFKQEKE